MNIMDGGPKVVLRNLNLGQDTRAGKDLFLVVSVTCIHTERR